MTSRRVSIVTGAAQGIGRAIALRLARDGLDVVVNDLESKSAEVQQLVQEIKGLGSRSIAVYGDVSSENLVSGLVEKTVSELGSLDVMVANAGIFEAGSLLTTSLETWERVMSINAQSAFLCTKHAANAMIKHGKGGRIILASSLAGKQGAANVGPYCASKFAVRGLAQAAASEFKHHHITVNAYAPGFIVTPMLDTVVEKLGKDIKLLDEISPLFIRPLGLKRDVLPTQGSPEEIAALVSYWAREESKYVTGQTWVIDGGTYFD